MKAWSERIGCLLSALLLWACVPLATPLPATPVTTAFTPTESPGLAPSSTVTPEPTSSLTPTNSPAPSQTPTETVTPSPTPVPLIAADFDRCDNINNLGGEMGAAFVSPDFLEEKYLPNAGNGCAANLEYRIEQWSAFWLKLNRADLTDYRSLVFDIKADPGGEFPMSFKIEIKRNCITQANVTTCEQVSINRVWVEDNTWQTLKVDLAEFADTGDPNLEALSAWTEIDELTFVFERSYSGPSGKVILDNILFEK